MAGPIFLTLAEIVVIHRNQIELYGGREGIRDMRLLLSALAQPEATFSGEWLHSDLYGMASAYAFHLCQGHAFFDGNKRTALAAALVFLEMNGVSVLDPARELLAKMIALASGRLGKKAFAEMLRRLPHERA